MEAGRVETVDDLRAVWRLTHDEFVDAGYIEPRSTGQLLHYPHLDLTPAGRLYPETSVLTLWQAGELVGTVSVTMDGPAGLHTDGTFPGETDDVRRDCQSHNWCLACSWRIVTAKSMRASRRVLLTLFDLVWRDCLERSIDVLLMLFHPRHAKIYERLYGLQSIAGPRPERDVNMSPAVMMRGQVHGLPWEENRKRLLRLKNGA